VESTLDAQLQEVLRGQLFEQRAVHAVLQEGWRVLAEVQRHEE